MVETISKTKRWEYKTFDFYTEEQPVSSINFDKQIPSEYYLECIEDSIDVQDTPEHQSERFRKYPQFESICRIIE